LQSITGTLSFLCKPIPCGRPFLWRLIDSIAGITNKHQLIPATPSLSADLEMWLHFLHQHNGVSAFLSPQWMHTCDLQLFTDASSEIGLGILYGNAWCQALWPEKWRSYSICFKEVFPILAALTIWGPEFANKRIRFFVDNEGAVSIINTSTSKCPRIMCLIRPLVLLCLKNNIMLHAVHIPTKKNNKADSLSRFQNLKFQSLHPTANKLPTPVPQHLFDLC